MYSKILVEPAKSSKSQCKNCNVKIDQKTLRVKVVDDRDFKAYIKKHGIQNLQCQGLHRGYFQDVNGIISIRQYFVHLTCYQPIELHPFQKHYFNLKSLNKKELEVFKKWLQEKNLCLPIIKNIKEKRQIQKKQQKKSKKKTKKIKKNCPNHRNKKTIYLND